MWHSTSIMCESKIDWKFLKIVFCRVFEKLPVYINLRDTLGPNLGFLTSGLALTALVLHYSQMLALMPSIHISDHLRGAPEPFLTRALNPLWVLLKSDWPLCAWTPMFMRRVLYAWVLCPFSPPAFAATPILSSTPFWILIQHA